ncbi:hypothetical protein [Halorientalis pallida]|uniref:Uncharacterized protein n=1 Tax=Halorientalis pallida TaxID=2479928 RepID=A0A498KUR1_9EURY|nr:hypothetical protein [Halorientalis pallida]RXK48702.1 hypothetical protein EAF64_13610 [Halorientalis pallida]
MVNRKLTLTSWQSEFETVEASQPDYYILTDVSDYEDLTAEYRPERVLECMDGTLWMANRINDAGLDIDIYLLNYKRSLFVSRIAPCHGVLYLRRAGKDI